MVRARHSETDSAERPQPVAAAPLDLYDYEAQRFERVTRPPRDSDPIAVTDDWPAIVPVTAAEVAIIEAHFGDVLDELFGPLP